MNLDSWLQHISSVHPREIELGLARIQGVAKRMQLKRPARYVITVAGTNGKGSCVACMEAMLEQAGYRTAAYTSPHIHRFNERVRVSAEAVADAVLCEAFALVDDCRGSISLSYFEFATLAALWIFQQAEVDIALLEVGLGGRLDAVNIIDPDVAVITNISLDHQDWLGADLESIGAEKAGILRSSTPAVYGAAAPPSSIVSKAAELAIPLYIQAEDFHFEAVDWSNTWIWQGKDAHQKALSFSNLKRPKLALSNASIALQALSLLPITLTADAINEGLQELRLAGRFELRRDRVSGQLILLDVAHNPAAAQLLAGNLAQYRLQDPAIVNMAVVLAVMADKDIEGMVTALASSVDICYVAQVEDPRRMPVAEAAERIFRSGVKIPIIQFESVQDAYATACEQASEHDLIVVTGSFRTIASVRQLGEIT